MELRHLAAFSAVAETLHFGRAAERLGVAQPAVSQLVARLERELGVALFERTSHRVAITTAGAALLPDARSALAAADRLRHRATELAAGTTGTLRVATTTGIGSRLAVALRTFSGTHPGVEVQLSVLPSDEKLAAVRDGAVDVALQRSSPDAPAGLRTRTLWREPLVAVVPVDHPAATRVSTAAADHTVALRASDGSGTPVDPAALADLPLVAVYRPEHPTMRDEVRAVCAAIGLDPRPGPQVHTPQEVLATIAAGAGWTLFVAGNVPSDFPGVAVRALPTAAPVSAVRAVWRAAPAAPWVAAFSAALEAAGVDET